MTKKHYLWRKFPKFENLQSKYKMFLFLKNIFSPTKKDKIGTYIVIILALLYIVMVVKRGAGDLHVYYKAAEALRLDRPVYGYEFLVSREELCGFSYPLFWAFVVMLVGWLPLALLDFVWLVFNLWLLFKIWELVHYFFDLQSITLSQKKWFDFILLLFSVRFILYNFDMSQVTILLLFLILKSLQWLEIEKTSSSDWKAIFWGAFLAALGVAIKLMPIFLIPYFFWRGRWRVGVMSLIFIILLMLIPAIWTGWETFWELQAKWWATINPTNKEFTTQQNREAEGVYSLSAFFNAYFFDDGVRLYGVRRHLWQVSAENLHTILTIGRLFFIGLTLFFVRFPPFRATPSRLHSFWEISYMLIAIVLVFPHQQKYAFLFLLPAFAYLIFTYFSTKNKLLLGGLIVVWLLSTASTDGIIGKYLYNFGQYFKIITFACFLTIILLMLHSPKKQRDLPLDKPFDITPS